MCAKFQRWFGCLLMLALIAFPSGRLAAQTNFLNWHKAENRVDADINSWDLREFLEHVAEDTGWRVYLDPKAVHNVSAKFKDLSTSEALHASLGDLNFILVPRQTNAAARLYVFRTAVGQATRLVAPPRKAAKPIPNELVVTLKPGSKTKIDDLARALGAKVIGRMDAQNAYLLQFQDDASTQAARLQLANNPDVASVDVNFPIDPPVGLNASDANSPDLQLKPAATNGNCQLVVGLIDTAVQTLPGNLNTFLKPQISVAGVSPATTTLNHGTAMAQTILDSLQKTAGPSGSTSVQILPVDVYGGNESTSTFDVASGIVQAVNNGANIINLSLGGTGDSQILHNTIIQVSQQGIPIYAAAGNDPVTTPTYPAAYPEVVSVTATDSTGQIASYANRGSFIDMTAPGDNVVGFGGQSYLVEGTSTSTAFASGAAAGLADASHVCANQAESLLQSSLPKSAVLKTAQ